MKFCCGVSEIGRQLDYARSEPDESYSARAGAAWSLQPEKLGTPEPKKILVCLPA
ncbi:hypothetical protein [[Phormidium] sp. LEGE 05292]|uniref:hypothetical protein n=1 Tax=[Phormidium] sp. LEGE 05292 TaxID=767427 RepID=UPI0018817CD7|nr:hypothetical protein [Phormidium sp. LEGE 05292]